MRDRAREAGESSSHIGVVGRKPNPVRETPVQHRRSDARFDQQQVRPFESGQSLGIGTLLRPPHHDDIVVMRGRRQPHRSCVSPHDSLRTLRQREVSCPTGTGSGNSIRPS